MGLSGTFLPGHQSKVLLGIPCVGCVQPLLVVELQLLYVHWWEWFTSWLNC